VSGIVDRNFWACGQPVVRVEEFWGATRMKGLLWCFLSILDANGEEKLKLSGRQREKEYKAALRWCLVFGAGDDELSRNPKLSFP